LEIELRDQECAVWKDSMVLHVRRVK
jgi:hypothetical protein